MKRSRIYVTKAIPENGLELLRRSFGRIDLNPTQKTLPRKELLAAVRGREGILSCLTDSIDEEVLRAAGPGLRAVSNYAVGTDNIDVAAATERGVAVTNTPGVLTLATAEMAWSLLLAAARRVAEGDRITRSGKFAGWGPTLYLGRAVTGKTLGVIGAGRIGTAFARLSKGFRMEVLYRARRPNRALERELGARRTSLPEILKRSDFLSLHVDLNPSTRGMIGRKEFSLMKPSAVLVNTSRGPVIDEKELVRALKSRKIFAAGLDVYEREPRLAPGLASLDNAVLAPHAGSATTEARAAMAELAAENLILALSGRRPKTCVNPEVL